MARRLPAKQLTVGSTPTDVSFKQATGDTDAPAAHRPHAVQCGCGWLGVFRAMASKACGFIVEAQWLSTRLRTWVLRVRVPSTAPEMATRRESVYHEARGRRAYDLSAAVRSVLLRKSRNRSCGSNTDECHVVRGYRFHARSAGGWRNPIVVAWASPALTSSVETIG